MERWFVTALGLFLFGSTPEFGESIKGFGQSFDEAKRAARQTALETLQQKLADHQPPLQAWQPSLADIEGMIYGPGQAGPSHFLDDMQLLTWVLKVRFPSDGEMELRDRRIQRQHAAAWVTLTAIAGVAAWSGALRWRERRRGS